MQRKPGKPRHASSAAEAPPGNDWLNDPLTDMAVRGTDTSQGGEVYEYDDNDDKEEAITMAHEFGHCLLHASDEYANPAVPDRVLTDDHSIMANYYAQGKDQAAFKVRHFQHICAEVARQYPGYRLNLVEM